MRMMSLVLSGSLLVLSSSAAVLAAAPQAGGEPATWFTTSQVAENVWRIDDHGADNMYLVVGTDKALLIDTGLGVGDIMKVVRTLTALPVVVVNTHGHPDHAGGNNQFSEVHAHTKDFGLIATFDAPERRAETRSAMVKDARVPADQLFEAPKDRRPTKLLPVTEGFVFDLGGRRLEVVEVPGHTLGGVCLLDRKHALLFSGDNNNTLQWQFLDTSTTIEAYLRTLEGQKARTDFTTLLPGHGPALDRGFLDEQIACARSILDGTCKDEPYKSFAGESRLCRHGRAQIAFDPAKMR